MKPVSVLALLLAVTSVRADDWPRWRGPAGTGVSQEKGWRTDWPEAGPPVAWKGNVGVGFSSVAVSKGRLVTLGNRDNFDLVTCLDAVTGKPIWEYKYECPLDDRLFEGGPTSTPTIDGNVVYALSRPGQLSCLDAATGKVRWSMNVATDAAVRVPGWGFASSPVVHGKLLVLNVGEAGTAVDRQTGKIVWTSLDRESGYNTPVLITRGESVAAVFASGKEFMAVDVSTGKLLWQHRWLTRFGCNAADAIVKENRIFISSGYNRGAALLEWTDAEPTVVWENKDMQNQLHSSVLVGDHLYGVDGQDSVAGRVKAVEFATGKVAWSEDLGGLASLSVADGKLILLTEQGELVVAPASPGAFKPMSRAKVLDGKCWTTPVLSNGYIYCRNAEGELVCVDVRDKNN